MKCSLYLNGIELLRIDHGYYYISGEYGVNSVHKLEFKEMFDKMRGVCENSWSEELQNEYKVMDEILNYVPDAVLALTNTMVLSVKLSDDGDSISYVYGYDNPITVPLEYDEDGNPYFLTKDKVEYFLDEFIRVDDFPLY